MTNQDDIKATVHFTNAILDNKEEFFKLINELEKEGPNKNAHMYQRLCKFFNPGLEDIGKDLLEMISKIEKDPKRGNEIGLETEEIRNRKSHRVVAAHNAKLKEALA